jgi:hypothetical protein
VKQRLRLVLCCLRFSFLISCCFADYLGWEDPGVGKHCLVMFFSGVFYLLALIVIESGLLYRLRRKAPTAADGADRSQSGVCVCVCVCVLSACD